ncbi:MarR family transcriptional regulator [Sinomonas notoginsengisoli]|uniref:MarR family winged helix-turn-helix transcriptional regulator n=1 Tax=Sinomonas notoginsengisoli TaxID=1457311 RepID=UPI001F172789|nr:MarR family transcriptional regulator [Sinomonas notoginsengisoli]
MSDANDDLLLERQLCFALSVASRSVITSYRPVLDKLGITHPQYLVMLALWERSPRTAKEISDVLLLEPATVTPLLKRLEDAGLLTRSRQRGNERALDVALTPRGAALRGQALSVPTTMMDRLNITRDEAAELHASMMRLIAAAQASRAADAEAAESLTAR